MTSPLPSWPTSTVLPHVSDDNDTLPKYCLYNRIIFSKNFSYYIQVCSPNITIVLSAMLLLNLEA